MAQRLMELINKRTATSKHFLRDDGKIEAEIYAGPVHYQDGQSWAEINTVWEREQGFGQKIKKAQHNLRIFGNTLRFGFAKQVYIDYTLPGELSAAGNRAELVDAWANSDLQYDVTPTGIKGSIILSAPGHPASFDFPLAATGCEPVQEGNRLVFYANGQPAGSIPAPWAEDANGQRGSVVLAYDTGVITLTPDADWLATAAYPVTIDPTTIQPDAAAGKDSYVYEGASSTNYGTSAAIRVGSDGSIFRGLVQFDLSTIAGAITEALLGVYCYDELAATNYDLTAHEITATWAEDTVTWNNKPAYEGTAADTVSITGTGAYFELDITTLTQAWRAGTKDNNGVMLVGNEINGDSRKTFYSSDHGTANERPKLTVTYLDDPTIVAPASVDDAAPTEYTDEVSPEIEWSTVFTQASYQVQILDSGSSVIIDTGEVAGAGTTYSPATSAGLVYGEVYQVKLRMKDDTTGVWSDWVSGHYLQCIYSAPANLVATADAAGAEIGLAWDAHGGENLAGYYIYRKVSTDAAYTLLKSTVHTTTTYDDEIAASGVTYDYKVSAVATDGYEGPQSTADQEAVTFTAWMINNTAVSLPKLPQISTPRRASARVKTDGTYEVQDLGVLPRRARFILRYETYAEMAALLALFPAAASFSYRDPQGRTFRGRVIGDIQDQPREGLYVSDVHGDLSFEAVEVSA